MKRKTTRRALVMSLLSLLLCCSMLVGTTFAWFTDSVTSGRNKIVAGNLDVVLEYWNGTEYAEVDGDTKLFNDAALWEPGHTEVAYLKVSNAGTLALKYQLSVNAYEETLGKTKTGETIKLSDHLVFSVVDKEITGTADLYTREQARQAAGTTYGLKSYNSGTLPLDAKGGANDADYVALIIYMPEEVGNEANHDGVNVPSILIGTELHATQLTAEADSFNNQYDKDAWMNALQVTTEDDLKAAIAAGQTSIALAKDIAVTAAVTIPEGATLALNLNGKTLSAATGGAILNRGTLDVVNGTVSSETAYSITNYGTLTVSDAKVTNGINSNAGAVTINDSDVSTTRAGYSHAVRHVGTGELIINGGEFTGNGNEVVQSEGSPATINGGTFRKVGQTSYLIGGRNMVINGGTFYAHESNPAGHPVRPDVVIKGGTYNYKPTNVAAGYIAVDNTDGTFTVLPKIDGVDISVDSASGLYWNGNAALSKGVYYVFSASELEKAAEYFQGQNHTNEANKVTLELMSDIDMTGKTWTPWNVMWLTLNGNGHTISNVTTTTAWRGGFFGYLGAATINNLTLKNVTASGAQAGILVGAPETVVANNVKLAGNNTVNYVPYADASYTETWGGIGAVSGVIVNSTFNVEIVPGATVTLNTNGMVTNCEYIDQLTGYLNANKGTVTNNGQIIVGVSDTGSLVDAIKNAPVGQETTITLATGTYAGDMDITVAALGASGGDVVIKAAEGAAPVITGTVTLGYREQTVGAAMWDGNVTFEGVTFDHAESGKHSLDIQDVKSINLIDCKIVGDGEYGIGAARGNGTGASKITGCTFENAAIQGLGNWCTGLVIEKSTFNNSRINIQAGNGVTVQECTFNNTLTEANVGDSFYLIRSNSTPITVKNCKAYIDSTLTSVASGQAKWYLLANRGTANWTVENVEVTLTEAAAAQTELKVTACTSTGLINGTVTVK